jgi:hypothetical protein
MTEPSQIFHLAVSLYSSGLTSSFHGQISIILSNIQMPAL